MRGTENSHRIYRATMTMAYIAGLRRGNQRYRIVLEAVQKSLYCSLTMFVAAMRPWALTQGHFLHLIWVLYTLSTLRYCCSVDLVGSLDTVAGVVLELVGCELLGLADWFLTLK